MQKGGFQNHPLMRLTLGLTLLLLVGFWATNAALYFSKMSLSPASVVSYYCGSEADFTPPRSYGSMLEVTHSHLAMMAMVLLFLTHLVIFVPAPRAAKAAFIVATFLSALTGEAAGWLVRFVSPGFAILKVAGFVTLQLTMATLILALAAYLFRAARADHQAAGLTHSAGPTRVKRKSRRRPEREQEGRPWQTFDASPSTPGAETRPGSTRSSAP
jgi:hypothetical protein